MNILHITPAYYPATYWGGPIFSVYHLNNALASLPGVELKVLTTDSAGPRLSERLDISALDETLYPGQEVIFTRRIAGACVSIGLLKRLPALIRWADVVHLTATYSFPTMPTILMCRLQCKPLVWSPRGAILDAYAWDRARKRRLKRVWEIICNLFIKQGMVTLHVTSEEEKAASLARIPNAAAAVVKNGVEVPEKLSGRKWLPEGMLRILFLGRLSPKKGIENLLETMKLLDGNLVRLTICGAGEKGYSECLKKRAGELGILGRNVYFVGQVDGAEKRSVFMDADVCIVPSFSENFCIVVAEALAMGLPVIVSSRLPQWKDVVRRNCGLWVDNKPETMAQAVRRIRDMDLEKMGRNGWKWMKDEFEWGTIAKDMYEVYQKISYGEDDVG